MNNILKFIGAIALGLIVAVFIVLNVVLWLTGSQRLNLLVERCLSDAIEGEVTIGSTDLTLWSSFPCAEVRLSDIRVMSHSLDSVPDYLRKDLTASYDSLLKIGSITADINVWKALHGDIEIDKIVVDGPECNLVVADANLANFDIIRKHHRSGKSALEYIKNLKGLHFNNIIVRNSGVSRYTSLLDSSEITFVIPDFTLNGRRAPDYLLNVYTEINTNSLKEVNLCPLKIEAKGNVKWNYKTPEVVGLDSLALSFNDFHFLVSAEADFSSDLSINEFDFTVNRLNVNTILSHIPPILAEECAALETDLEFTFNMALTDTLFVARHFRVPSAKMTLDVPDCEIHYGDAHITSASLAANAFLDGAELNSSVVTVDRLHIGGEGFIADISGRVTSLLEDPRISAKLVSDVNISRLPAGLMKLLPMKLRGMITTDAGVEMRLSDLSESTFHRIMLSGVMKVRDLAMRMNEQPVSVSARNAEFSFGKTSAYADAARFAVDSLLSLSLAIDTATVTFPGNRLGVADFLADVGNPYGMGPSSYARKLNALIRIAMFTVDAPHDIRVRFRDSETFATLLPYNADQSMPEVDLNFTARRFTTRGPGFGVAFSQPVAKLKSHMLADAKVPVNLPRRGHINELDTILRDDAMDWNVATFLQKIMLTWDVTGNVFTNAGFVFVHDFPLRQRASDIDMDFTTDSVTINSLRYLVGNSVFNVKGRVSNMARSFTSPDRSVPLVADLDLTSPRVDINELLVTSLHETSGNAGPDPDYTERMTVDHRIATDTAVARPLIIPKNIAANLRLRADTVLYSDLTMRGLSGSILVANSALNLHELQAASPVGSVNLSALYWAPDTTDMRFGMGLELSNFDLGRTLKLVPPLGRMLPALRGFKGNIDAEVAATTNLRPDMTIDMDSFKGAVKLEGDSLALVDPEKFRSLSRWLLFHDREYIDIDHMDVEMVISDRRVDLFPFIFDIDRYRLGVMGSNNLDMDLNYHVSVLKSPIPFKFGINVTGPARHPKIRLGGAKIKPGMVRRFNIADTTRRTLLSEIRTVFDLGTMSHKSLNLPTAPLVDIDEYTDTLSAEEMLWLKREGWYIPDDDDESKKTDTDRADDDKKHRKHRFWIF